MPGEHASLDDALDLDQTQRMLEAIRTERESALIRLMILWGLRASEAAHANRSWVENKGAGRTRLRIPAKCSCPRCQETPEVWTPKTPKGSRALPIHKHTPTITALQAYWTKHPEPWVSRQTVYDTVVRVADRAGIMGRVYPHALRATAATAWASRGLTEHQLMKVMGWADPRSARPYIRHSGIDLERAIDNEEIEIW